MKTIMRTASFLILCVFATLVVAQKGKKTETKAEKKPGASTPTLSTMPIGDARMRTSAPKSYPDSAEFNKAFKELYPLVKPKGSIRQFAEKQVERQLQSLVRQGADSVEVVKAAYKGLDEDAAYKIYFDTYREELTAKDLRAYITFLKTPEGEKIQSVTGELMRATAEVTRYINQTVNTNLTPLRNTMREKTMKEQQDRDVQMRTDTTEVGKRYREQMHMRDSIMKARGISLPTGNQAPGTVPQPANPPSPPKQ